MNFSFVIPEKLAGMARPGSMGSVEQDAKELANKGIGGLVSLTPSRVDPAPFLSAGIEPILIPVHDFTAPALEQIQTFVDFAKRIIASGKGVVVHCTAGLGRTGTMLACFFVQNGAKPNQAIDEIRRLRPGSIETSEQEGCIHAYARHLGGTAKGSHNE